MNANDWCKKVAAPQYTPRAEVGVLPCSEPPFSPFCLLFSFTKHTNNRTCVSAALSRWRQAVTILNEGAFKNYEILNRFFETSTEKSFIIASKTAPKLN